MSLIRAILNLPHLSTMEGVLDEVYFRARAERYYLVNCEFSNRCKVTPFMYPHVAKNFCIKMRPHKISRWSHIFNEDF